MAQQEKFPYSREAILILQNVGLTMIMIVQMTALMNQKSHIIRVARSARCALHALATVRAPVNQHQKSQTVLTVVQAHAILMQIVQRDA
jgi:hypothetical protein